MSACARSVLHQSLSKLLHADIQVDPASGLIRTKHQVDYDKYPLLVFDVLAIDEGSPSLTGTTTVTILVSDVNDIRPHFEKDFLNLATPCDEDVGTHVATISATDDDSGFGNSAFLNT